MDWITCIRSVFEDLRKPDLKQLKERLSRLPDPGPELEQWVKEPEDSPHGRTILFRNDQLEIILIHLPAQTATPIHDHGESLGCARVLEGKLNNILYQNVERGVLASMTEYPIHPDGFFYSPRGIIHRMANRTAVRALSLHAYAPPLKGNRVYAEP